MSSVPTYVLSLFGLVITTLLTTIGYVIKKAIDRYYDLQKVKEEKADEHAKMLAGKMEEISHSVNSLMIKSDLYFEKVTTGAKILEETVRRVDKLEWHVFPNKSKTSSNYKPNANSNIQ